MSYLSRLSFVLAGAALLFASSAYGVNRDRAPRNFDARSSLNAALNTPQSTTQDAAIAALRSSVPELAVSFDHATGVTRTLSNRVGYLTGPQAGDHQDIALAYVQANLALLGLTPADLSDYEITDSVYSAVTGATHLYLRQRAHGLSLFNGQLHINVNRDGRILSVNNAFLPGLASAVNTTTPQVTATDAVLAAAAQIQIGAPGAVTVVEPATGTEHRTVLSAPGVSTEAIEAKLMLLPIRAGEARLVWHFWVHTHDRQHMYAFNVDAIDATVWTRYDAVDGADYTVYPQPVESPTHTAPAPPADARVVVSNPADATASPHGWHDTNNSPGAEFTIMRGNNVHAYQDRNSSNGPPGSQPDCGPPLACNFPIDLTVDPKDHIPASVANLFYWNNIIHDVQYQYGFDEAAGNFQENNYGNGGSGSDGVLAEAQDDSNDNSTNGGNCNANFATPGDGSNPRMQMYTCDIVSPERDGDLDNGVIIHEYGHGISNRLIGGPTNVFCLQLDQQPGEGLSDWWSLAYTHEPGDTGPDARGIGTYLFGQGPDGPGIRSFPYSTDFDVNPDTYSTIGSRAAPHGVGSVWAEIAWEVYWALVDKHGFDPNLYNALGGSGNQRAMLYVNEGLKNTVCAPTFADVRDGIIQAATDNFGGEDVCMMWGAFAKRGLGADAIAGTPATTVVVDGFSLPRDCQADFTMDVTPEQIKVCLPDDANYSVDVGLNLPVLSTTVMLSVSGEPAGSTATFSPNNVSPPATSTLTIGSLGAGAVGYHTLTVTGDDGGTHQTMQNVDLAVFSVVPGVTTLVAPASGAVNVSVAPTFSWTDPGQGDSYEIDLASDPGFTNIVGSATVSTTSHSFDFTLATETTYHWRVRVANTCGQSDYTTGSFTTGLLGGILLVDDDDNEPDVRAAYTDALDALNLPYTVWDTANTDNEPSATQLEANAAVVWFTGDEFGGFAGPGADGEAALTEFLDGGGCLLLSSQDYFYDRGNTPFMTSHLGLATATSDVEQTTVSGTGTLFGGLGPYTLSYPVSNFSDDLVPVAFTAELGFTGNASLPGGGAGINMASLVNSAFLGFPLEAVPTAGRIEILARFLIENCGLEPAPDSDGDGVLDTADNCIGTPNADQTDSDADGVGDACDNCRLEFNPDQCNTNAPDADGGDLGDDLFGNVCDADLNNDNIVNSFDLSIMRNNFGQMGENDADLSCDGTVNSFDLSIMRSKFGQAPGPGASGP